MAIGTNAQYGTIVIKALADLPARMIGGTAIEIAIQGFDYRVNLDLEKQTPAPSLDASKAWTVVWDENTNAYWRVAFDRLPAPALDWNIIINKPTAFPPAAHTHAITDVTNLQPSLDGKTEEAPEDGNVYGRRDQTWVDLASGVPISVQWADVLGKPTAFPPDSHTHTANQISNATTVGQALMTAANPAAGRSAIAAISTDDNARVRVLRAGTSIGTRRAINIIDGANVTTTVADDPANERVNITIAAAGGGGTGGIPEAPEDGVTYGRRDAGWVTLTTVTYSWNDLTDKPATFPPSVHSHPISEVTSLQTALDAKISDAPNNASVYGRSGAAWVDLAAATQVTWANVTGKPTVFPPAAHNHAIAEVTSLQTALDAKIPDAPSDGTQYARKDAAWARVALYPPHGGTELYLIDANTLGIRPKNGESLMINGVPRPVVAATFLRTALASATVVNYIYARWNATLGRIDYEASTTGHVTHTNGIEIKSGDPTVTLVGKVNTYASTTLRDDDTARLVLSWFNRRRKPVMQNANGISTAAAGALAPLGAASYFLVWPDDNRPTFTMTGFLTTNAADVIFSAPIVQSTEGKQFATRADAAAHFQGTGGLANMALDPTVVLSLICGMRTTGAATATTTSVTCGEIRG